MAADDHSDYGSNATETSLTRALGMIGDPWSLNIIRIAFLGCKRFQDFQETLAIPKQTLMLRLKKMTENAIMYRQPVRDTRIVYEYRLTPKGLDLYPFAMMNWGWHTRWVADGGILPRDFVHHPCNTAPLPILRCSACGEGVPPESVSYQKAGANIPLTVPKARKRQTRIVNEWFSLGEGHLAMTVTGDYWSIMLLDAAFKGVENYDSLQRTLSISSNVLSARLKTLVKLQLLEQRPSTVDRRKLSYSPTAKARDLFPLILTLINWGDRWLAGDEPPPEILFHDCGAILVPEVACEHCSEPLTPDAVTRPEFRSPSKNP